MKYAVSDTSLSALADAIREKTGKTDLIPFKDMPGEIKGIESGSLLSDNLAKAPGESLIGNNYTINADGSVTVNAYSGSYYVMMYWGDDPAIFSFLPMENGKKYKLTVTPSEDVGDNTLIVNYACVTEEISDEIDVCEINFKNGGSATFTTPKEPYYLQFITLPCLSDKSVTYTFELREVLEKEDIYEEGFEAGKKAEYDAFWDSFQQNGNKTMYNGAFRSNWNDEIFKPKYNFILSSSGASQMFQNSGIVDLKGILEKQRVKLDTSKCTSLLQMFQTSATKYIPEIDARLSTNMSYTFGSNPSVASIDKLIVSETTPYSNTFSGARHLTHVIFEGTIGKNGLSLEACDLLDKESIESIINALSTTTTDLTVTLSTDAVNTAFESAEGLADGSTSEEWQTLIATKSNWKIELV